MYKIYVLFFSISVLSPLSMFAQPRKVSSYAINPIVDIPVSLGFGAASLGGLLFILKKEPTVDSAYAVSLTPSMVNRFDRGATHHYIAGRGTPSNIALYSSYSLPLFLLLDKSVRSEALKIGLLYVETMAVMGATYTIGVGLMKRNRPYMYNQNVPLSQKMKKGEKDSFFAGHIASAATASFFAAKVFNDYHPDSPWRYVIWGAALVPPVVVGYYRYIEGMHFPTDIIAGTIIGGAIGIVVPEIHRRLNHSGNLSFTAAPSRLSLTWTVH